LEVGPALVRDERLASPQLPGFSLALGELFADLG
jgi:hypothetical protein